MMGTRSRGYGGHYGEQMGEGFQEGGGVTQQRGITFFSQIRARDVGIRRKGKKKKKGTEERVEKVKSPSERNPAGSENRREGREIRQIIEGTG